MRETFPKSLATLFPVILAGSLCGCAPGQPGAPYSLAPSPPPAPYSLAARLPYPACGDMATLRANLTGTPWETPQSDAELRALGVRCVGEGPTVLHTRY